MELAALAFPHSLGIVAALNPCSLLRDAFLGECDTAVVISSDSDLAEAVRIAQDDAGVRVGVVNPHPKRSRSSRLQGKFFKQVRESALARAQLPVVVYDHSGPIHKPSSW